MTNATEIKQYEIASIAYLVPVDDIQTAPFQPKDRTEKQALKKLMRTIKEAGRVIVPLVVAADGTLADGHRRLACAKALGYTHVPVLFEGGAADWLFAVVNGGIMPPKAKTWGGAVASGLDPALVPSEVRGWILDMLRLLGTEGFADMASRRSPAIMQSVRSFVEYVGDESDDFQRAALVWMDKYNMVRPIIDAMRDCAAPDALMAAVHEDRLFQKVTMYR